MTFEDLNLNKPLLNALAELNLVEPTAIQAKVFSPIMAGEDVLGIAQTGTGKTYAYLLPSLRLWQFTKSPLPQILILVPTRELVMQLITEIEKLSTYMNVVATPAYGGTNMRYQKASIAMGVDIVVGTPGRLLDLMLDGVLKTKNIKRLIIDEVDEMLDLGFRTQLKNIISHLPERRQNLMFSATITEEVKQVIDQYTQKYKKLETAPSGAPLENIEQSAYELPNFNSKANMLEWMLVEKEEIKKLLVFVSTKKMADALYKRMSIEVEEGKEDEVQQVVGVIHSSKSQNYRFNTVNRFQDGTFRFIIATDIIARGLDVSSVTHVLNFDLPDTAEKYIHRIGRTGRAEKKGIAISFVSEEEKIYQEGIEELMGRKVPVISLPEADILTEELIDLEKPVEFVPFNNHKMKEHTPSGDAFHEKSDKNKKENNKIRRVEQLKMKYKKPKTRGMKRRKKKK